jgi:hypothetical protein
LQRADGTAIALSDWSGELSFSERRPDGTDVTPVSPESVPALLEEHFGLGGFTLAADGSLQRPGSAGP